MVGQKDTGGVVMVDIGGALGSLFTPLAAFLGGILSALFWVAALGILTLIAAFFISSKINPLRLSPDALRAAGIKWKYFDLARWMIIDVMEHKKHINEFREYGFTFYVGRQGAGKTASMVNYLDRMKERYPNSIIVTNFGYFQADHIMKSWRDLLTIRNGTDGVIFAIDEIHSEYSSMAWKDVPEDLLSEISQQRKQRVKIVATAQFFTRVAKPLREQAATVVACRTFAGRLTMGREYDALQYAMVIDNPNAVKKKLKPLRKHSFVQSDVFRKEYDTYEKIERMEKMRFTDKDVRKQ